MGDMDDTGKPDYDSGASCQTQAPSIHDTCLIQHIPSSGKISTQEIRAEDAVFGSG
jgi:hypothetical protein